jgi:hypothetical protein
MVQLGSHWTNFHEIRHLYIFRKTVVKMQASLKSDNNKGYFTWYMQTSVHLYLTHFFLEWEMFQTFRENQNKHFVFNNFFPENRTLYEILWKNTVKPDRPQMTIWHMRTACWVPKNTYSQYATLVVFHWNNGCTNGPQCYGMRALPVLFLHDHASHYTTCCFPFSMVLRC